MSASMLERKRRARRRIVARAVEQQLGGAAQAGERRLELVADVGGQRGRLVGARVQAPRHLVERAGQIADLVAAIETQALAARAGGDAIRGAEQLAQRPRDRRRQEQRQHRGDRQDDEQDASRARSRSRCMLASTGTVERVM